MSPRRSYSTVKPIDFAVPSIVFIADARLDVLRSTIFFLAIVNTYSRGFSLYIPTDMSFEALVARMIRAGGPSQRRSAH